MEKKIPKASNPSDARQATRWGKGESARVSSSFRHHAASRRTRLPSGVSTSAVHMHMGKLGVASVELRSVGYIWGSVKTQGRGFASSAARSGHLRAASTSHAFEARRCSSGSLPEQYLLHVYHGNLASCAKVLFAPTWLTQAKACHSPEPRPRVKAPGRA